MHNGADLDVDRWRILEAEETLRAIRQGAVDAFVVEEPEGDRVYTLEGAELPYSALVERMQQGAAMLNAHGEIVYCNPSLADLLGVAPEAVIGVPLREFIEPAHQPLCQKLLNDALLGSSVGEMNLGRTADTAIPASFSFRVLARDNSTIGVLVTDLTAQKNHAALTSRLQRLQDEERKRIAQELHDSVGQLLAAVAINISRLKQEAHKLSAESAALVDDNAAMIDEISTEIRTISHLLHPPLLDVAGLASAIRWYVDGFSERSKIKVDLEIPEEFPKLPSDAEIAIFRMIQECLTNVHRHSGSTSCAVKIVRDEKDLHVEIRDSGRGISESKQKTFPSSAGVGLRGMQGRLRQLGGTLTITSSDKGTTVVANLPISPAGSDSV